MEEQQNPKSRASPISNSPILVHTTNQITHEVAQSDNFLTSPGAIESGSGQSVK